MSDVIFRATSRGGKNFVEVMDTGTDFDRYEIKMNGSIDYSDTIKGVLAKLIHHSGWKSGMFDKIEFDDTGMSLGEQYLQIMKMINKEFGFLYKSPTGSRERQYYFDIIRFISQNIKNGTMSIEEVIEKSKDALRAKGIVSSRRPLKSSQKGFENVVEGTKYDDYHIDTNGMGILSVENIIEEIEGRGNQAVLTVQTSDGSTNHSQFGSKDWKEYKDSVNDAGNSITDVWVTEVEGGSYVRNSRRLIKSGYDILNVGNKTPAGNLVFYLVNDGKRMPIMTEDYAIREGGYDKGYLYEGSKNGEFVRFDGFSSIINRLAEGCGLGEEIEQIEYYITGNKVTFTVYLNERGIHLLNNGWWDDYSVKWELSAEEQIPLYGADEKIAMSVELTILGLSNDLTSSRKITSARYIATDPETGEVLGSADTYEEAVNEWGEDVTITDSEAAEGEENMGLFQSRRPIKSSLHTEVVENFPEYMVNYAVYGEHLDVTDEDVSLYEEWRERNGYGTCFGTGSVYDESYFSNNPAFGLPCTVISVVFEVSDSITSSRKSIKSGINDECIGTSKDGRYSIYKNDVDKVYMFAEDDYVIKEVDYDDPEVEGVLENWKEIYDIPLKSSKKPETTKQFMTRILSELEEGKITEDEAAEEIAEANDVNIGYAKQILSNYIADKDRYITSGMLELGEALNMEFNPDGNLDSWSVDFVSDPEKPAPTLGGELVRAARYIIAAFRDNEEKVGWGYAREVLNPAARFIVENTDYKQNDVFEDLLDGQTYNDDAYRQFIDMFEIDFADYLRDHEELFHRLNKKSFEENTSESDEYSSIDEIIITDDKGNEYLFKYDGDNYVCYGIDEGYSPEYLEGDVLTPEDYPYDNVDFNEEFGEFEQDGFVYSWEDGDGESIRISDVSLTNPMFDYDDVLNSEEVGNLIENGTEVYDINHNELKVSDIM